MSNILLVDVFESFLGEIRKHNEDTGQISFDCPACSADKGMPEGDGKGNLELNYNKNVFKCWSCQDINDMHGSIFRLIKRYGNEKTLKNYLLLKPDNEYDFSEKKEIIVTLPKEFIKLSNVNPYDYTAKQALSYLYDRGITDEIIKNFNIGYVNNGKLFNRIIVPSYNRNDKLNYYIARWYSKKYTKLKYINPEAEKQEIIFNEGKLNLDATIYLVEGVFDHLVVPNSIPLLGKYVSPNLLELLHDYAMGYIVIIMDGDAYEDSVRLYKELNFGNLRDRIRLIRCPEDHDPSSINERLGPKGIIKLLMTARQLKDIEL
jgi:DNA primase